MKRIIQNLSVRLFLLLPLLLLSCERLSFDLDESSDTVSGLDVKCKITTVAAGTRSSLVKDAAQRLIWAILDENGKIVKIGEQTRTNSKFGTLSIDADPGEYSLVIFAYDGSDSCSMADGGIVTPANNKVCDSFSAAIKTVVSKSKRQELSIVLKRCVAKFQVNSTDVVPENVSRLHAVINGVSLSYNILDSIGTEITDIDRPVQQLGSQQSGKTFNGYIYTFLPLDSADVTVRMDFLDADNRPLYSHTFDSFQMRVNYISSYKGPLFVNSGLNSDITVDDVWAGQIPIEYP